MLQKEPNKPDPEEPAATPAVTSPVEPAAKPPDDELLKRLRAAAKKKRPWGVLTWLLTILLIGIPTGLLTWLLWPRPLPPELIVFGFDSVTSLGKEAILRAATEPAQVVQGAELKQWPGQTVYFQDVGADRDNRDKLRQARTNIHGFAELNWPAAKVPGVTTIDVRYVDERRFRHWYDRTQIRLFTWPRDARLLVIDVESTLRKTDDWSGLTKALLEAEQAGWHIVYLAQDADKPPAYSKARNWIMEQSSLPEDSLVPGPVLARSRFFTGESEAAARKRVLAQLKVEFTGTISFLTSTDGLKLHTVDSAGELTSKPIGLKTWEELMKELKKL